MLQDISPEEGRGEMLPSGAGRSLAILPLLRMNSLPDPIQKAFLSQKGPWVSTGSGTKGSKHFQPLFVEGVAGGLQGLWLHKSYVTARTFSISIQPCSRQSMCIQAWEGKKEGEGWVQLCCHNDRAPEDPSPLPSPFPNQPSSCSRQTAPQILPQQDPELSLGFLLPLEKKGEEALATASVVQGDFSNSRKKILAQTKMSAHEFLKEKELRVIKRVKINT